MDRQQLRDWARSVKIEQFSAKIWLQDPIFLGKVRFLGLNSLFVTPGGPPGTIQPEFYTYMWSKEGQKHMGFNFLDQIPPKSKTISGKSTLAPKPVNQYAKLTPKINPHNQGVHLSPKNPSFVHKWTDSSSATGHDPSKLSNFRQKSDSRTLFS